MATINYKNKEEVNRVFARINALKPNSSAYNYYLSTPINELKSREEKLIKKELELHRLKVLSEEGEGVLVDSAPEKSTGELLMDKVPDIAKTTYAAGAIAGGSYMISKADEIYDMVADNPTISSWVEALKETFTNWSKAIAENMSNAVDAVSTRVNDVAGDIADNAETIATSGDNNAASTIETASAKLINGLNNLRIWIGDAFADAGEAIKNAWNQANSTFITPYISEPINKALNAAIDFVSTQYMKLFGIENTEDIDEHQKWLIATAIIIIALYAGWKLVSWIFKEDGSVKTGPETPDTVESTNESLQYSPMHGSYIHTTVYGNPASGYFNPFYNNLGLAVICESADTPEESTGDMWNSILNFGDTCLRTLLMDVKFSNVMRRNNQEDFLNKLEERAENPEVQSESNFFTLGNSSKLLLEEADITGLENPIESEPTGILGSVANMFKRAGVAIGDGYNYVADKIRDITRRLENSKYGFWIPTAVKAAILIISVYGICKASGLFGSQTNSNQPSPQSDKPAPKKEDSKADQTESQPPVVDTATTNTNADIEKEAQIERERLQDIVREEERAREQKTDADLYATRQKAYNAGKTAAEAEAQQKIDNVNAQAQAQIEDAMKQSNAKITNLTAEVERLKNLKNSDSEYIRAGARAKAALEKELAQAEAELADAYRDQTSLINNFGRNRENWFIKPMNDYIVNPVKNASNYISNLRGTYKDLLSADESQRTYDSMNIKLAQAITQKQNENAELIKKINDNNKTGMFSSWNNKDYMRKIESNNQIISQMKTLLNEPKPEFTSDVLSKGVIQAAQNMARSPNSEKMLNQLRTNIGMKTVEENDTSLNILSKYADAITIICEQTEKLNNMGIKEGKELEALKGKGEILAKNLVERAKQLSDYMLTNDEFITFSKQNPEILNTLKAAEKEINKLNAKKKS